MNPGSWGVLNSCSFFPPHSDSQVPGLPSSHSPARPLVNGHHAASQRPPATYVPPHDPLTQPVILSFPRQTRVLNVAGPPLQTQQTLYNHHVTVTLPSPRPVFNPSPRPVLFPATTIGGHFEPPQPNPVRPTLRHPLSPSAVQFTPGATGVEPHSQQQFQFFTQESTRAVSPPRVAKEASPPPAVQREESVSAPSLPQEPVNGVSEHRVSPQPEAEPTKQTSPPPSTPTK